ncbi:MAG TPA: low temperature requirement protein A [Candidatus Dormibacteraeota bacterium]|nr:low temperature requirement protein A [Candidatus Dormibacteraeota bacterium]
MTAEVPASAGPELRAAGRRPTWLARHYALGFGAAAVIWLGSAVAPVPARFALWAVAMVVDYATPLTARRPQAQVQLDPSHLPERFGLFTLIVLGESIAASAGSLAGRWDLPAAVGGALGIAAAFGVWWSYFDHLERAPVRRTRLAGQVWFYAHLPFLMAMTALAVGIRELIGGSEGGRTIAWRARRGGCFCRRCGNRRPRRPLGRLRPARSRGGSGRALAGCAR